MDMPMPPPLPSDVVEQLRDALKHADRELQRRCVISSQIRDAVALADDYLHRTAVHAQS
jgi:hypothetical protein